MDLKRINKTVKTTIPLQNGYAWVLLRHNIDCTDLWRKEEIVICWIFKNHETFDSDRIIKLRFEGYKNFKTFKDLLKKSIV